MNLSQALRLTRNSKAVLVGAGGKTTALFQLARQLEPPVVVTCSTHLGEWQLKFADRVFQVSRAEDVDRFAGQIEGVSLFTGPPGESRRVGGLAEDALARINALAGELGFPVLVEGDGSRQKPLKAPGPHEPAIPAWTNHVIVIAGLSGLGKPLDGETVHRVEAFSRLSGIEMGGTITLDGLMRVLDHPKGGLKNIPSGAKKSLVLNQIDQSRVEPEVLFNHIMRIANYTTNPFHSISITSLEKRETQATVEPVAGIILAAGEASRYGQPKLLVEWKGKPLIRHAAEKAVAAGTNWTGVVVGAVDEPIERALAGLPVHIIRNPDWRQGQSTSVRAGIAALPEHTGAAVFLLGDQPGVPTGLITTLIDRHRRTQARIIAPTIQGRRANPVLFDRETFPGLSRIEGDTGGRAIFGKYEIDMIEWDDPAALLDIDTPDDLDKLRNME